MLDRKEKKINITLVLSKTEFVNNACFKRRIGKNPLRTILGSNIVGGKKYDFCYNNN